jgi:hypothetical protein
MPPVVDLIAGLPPALVYLAVLLAQPVFILVSGLVLFLLGASRKRVAEWALQRSRRILLVELVQAWRGTRPRGDPPPDDEGDSSAPPGRDT